MNNITSTADDAITTSNSTAPPSLAPSSYNSDTTFHGSTIMQTDYGGTDSGYNEGSTFTFVLGVAFVFLFMVRMYQIQRNQNQDSNTGNGRGRSFHGYSANSRTAGSGIRLSLEDRIELYKKAFESNGNQLTLQDKHIVTKTMKKAGHTTSNTGDTEEGVEQNNNRNESFIDIELGDDDNGNDNDNDNDDSSIYLSFESDRNNCNSNHHSTITTSTKSLRLEHKQEQENHMIHGTCVICFEDFLKDDVIVWSNDSSCHHIYHKECMVSYLAQNAQRKITSPLDITDNACPTCRRPDYCLVSDDDLVQILSSIQPQTIPIENNSNEDEDDDDSDETADEVAAAAATTTTVTTAAAVIETTTNEESLAVTNYTMTPMMTTRNVSPIHEAPWMHILTRT